MAITDPLTILKAHCQNDIARALDAAVVRFASVESTSTITVTSLLPTEIGTSIALPAYGTSIMLVIGAVTFSHSAADQFVYLNLYVNGISTTGEAVAQVPAEYSAAHGKETKLERIWVLTPAPGVQTYQLGLCRILSGTTTSKYQKLTAINFRIS